MNIKQFVILAAILVTLVFLHNSMESRDYTNLTNCSPPTYPDIAIDLTSDKVYPKWKLSKKRLTDRREK